GVSFENEDGSSRQAILRKMKFKDPPFDTQLNVHLRSYEYKPGEDTIGVFVNGAQIGNVPSAVSPYLEQNMHNLVGVTNIIAYGGGDGKSFGCELTLRMKQ
ncbi:MAG: hypothetical protein ACK5L3_07490, partial [Oscillospiraceae bacterium]